MPFRVTDASNAARRAAQIMTSQQRVTAAQERVSSGKRINRPSDDPSGAEAVIRLRTSQAVVEQFRRSTGVAKDKLLIADGALDNYERVLDRAHTLLVQGASDFTGSEARKAIAEEIEGIYSGILSTANMRSDDGYVFGGTRQDAPPFDPTTAAPAASTASSPLLQIEPGAPPVTVGVTAETVFSDSNGTIFDTLTAVAAALRGTGDPAADRTTINTALDRLSTFAAQARVARTRIGASLNAVESADQRLNHDFFSLEVAAQQKESADFVESAVQLTEAQRALEATLRANAYTGQRSLIDLLG